MKKEDTTSPNVATEILFTNSTIGAFEGLNVTTMDIPSAFLHTPIDPKDPKVHMALQGKLADLMVKVDTNFYRKIFSTNRKGRMILYV